MHEHETAINANHEPHLLRRGTQHMQKMYSPIHSLNMKFIHVQLPLDLLVFFSNFIYFELRRTNHLNNSMFHAIS